MDFGFAWIDHKSTTLNDSKRNFFNRSSVPLDKSLLSRLFTWENLGKVAEEAEESASNWGTQCVNHTHNLGNVEGSPIDSAKDELLANTWTAL